MSPCGALSFFLAQKIWTNSLLGTFDLKFFPLEISGCIFRLSLRLNCIVPANMCRFFAYLVLCRAVFATLPPFSPQDEAVFRSTAPCLPCAVWLRPPAPPPPCAPAPARLPTRRAVRFVHFRAVSGSSFVHFRAGSARPPSPARRPAPSWPARRARPHDSPPVNASPPAPA